MDHFSTLKHAEIFRNMPDEDVAKIDALCVERKFAKEATIMEEGSEGTEFFILPGGRVGIDVRVGDGVYRQRAYELMDGDVLGELAIFGHRRSARVRALEDVKLLAIPCAEFKQLLREVPRIGYYTMSNLASILAERLVMANIGMQDMMSRHAGGG